VAEPELHALQIRQTLSMGAAVVASLRAAEQRLWLDRGGRFGARHSSGPTPSRRKEGTTRLLFPPSNLLEREASTT
jgi:hypothetical protein